MINVARGVSQDQTSHESSILECPWRRFWPNDERTYVYFCLCASDDVSHALDNTLHEEVMTLVLEDWNKKA